MHYENILYAAIGWLFGLLAPAITDWIKEGRRTTLVRQAIRAELHGHARRMAIAYSRVETNRGRYKRAEIAWVRAAMLRHYGPDELINICDKMLAYTDGDLEMTAALASTNDLVGLRENKLPYLAAKLPTVETFSELERQGLLNIMEQTEQFNSLVRDAEYWGRQTFSGSENDRHISSRNANTSCDNASKKAVNVVEAIDAYLALPEPRFA